MNLQEKLERMATTASELRLLRRWLETGPSDTPVVSREAVDEAANTEELEPASSAATGTDGG